MFENLRGKTDFLACFFGLPKYIVEIFSTRISPNVARYSAKGALHIISGDEMIFSILEQISNYHYYLFENTALLGDLLKKYSEKQKEEIIVNEEIIISDEEDFKREINNFIPTNSSFSEDSENLGSSEDSENPGGSKDSEYSKVPKGLEGSGYANNEIYFENTITNFPKVNKVDPTFQNPKKNISRSVLCPDGNIITFVETITFKRFMVNEIFENIFPREFSPEDIDDSEIEDLYGWLTGINDTRC